MSKELSLFLPAFLLVILISSCKDKIKPVTQEEAKEFAKQVEISIRKGDAAFLDDAIDTKIMIKKMDLPSGTKTTGMNKGLKEEMKFGTAIVNSLAGKGNYDLVKQYEKDKVQHLVFRMFKDYMVNYHDLELINTNSKTKIADVYVYLTGENLSETMRGLYLQMDENIGKTDGASQWLKKIPEIRTLITANRYDEANNIFNEIPQNIRAGHAFQLMHLQIATGLGAEDYDKAISEYKILFPNDRAIPLLMIDAHISRHDYDKALQSVNELDSMINKDPLLDLYRAFCYNLLYNYEKQKECLERLADTMPYFEEGLTELIKFYLKQNKYELARPFVERFKTKSEFNQQSMTDLLNRYPEYNSDNTNK